MRLAVQQRCRLCPILKFCRVRLLLDGTTAFKVLWLQVQEWVASDGRFASLYASDKANQAEPTRIAHMISVALGSIIITIKFWHDLSRYYRFPASKIAILYSATRDSIGNKSTTTQDGRKSADNSSSTVSSASGRGFRSDLRAALTAMEFPKIGSTARKA